MIVKNRDEIIDELDNIRKELNVTNLCMISHSREMCDELVNMNIPNVNIVHVDKSYLPEKYTDENILILPDFNEYQMRVKFVD